MSIWMAVMPRAVPQTLKSMSPRWSSSPRMSLRMAMRVSSPSRDEPHRDAGDRRLDRHARVHERERAAADRAIDDEPFDSSVSETTRIV